MKPSRSNFFRAHGPTALGERYERLCEADGPNKHRPERATLERVWVLADRLHHLFEVRKELGKAREFGAALRQPENRDDLMLVKLEVWLNAILRLIKPTLIEELYERGKRFTLFTSYLHLEVLPKVELDLAYEDRNQITCPIRRAMLAAKEVRNPETHDSSSSTASALSEAYDGVAAVVVTTLLRHEDQLRAATRALLLQPLDLPAALQQCASIRNEHLFHLKTFAGRRAWLDRLDELAREAKAKASPRIIVIHGAQGQGKSGLMAQWAARTAASSGHDWHPNTGEVVRDAAPWLSGCLYLSAKIAKQPQAVAQSLLFQMSALVLEPVDEPHASREGRGSLRRPSLAPGATGAAPTRADRSLVSLDFSALDHFDLDIQLQEHPAQVTTEQYQWAITDGLRRLVAERGPVTVVFDAADEVLEAQASGLDVLPAQWPDGVTAIFTVRDGPHRGGLLAKLVGAETWALGPLTLEDVAEVLGLEGRDSAEAQRLHAQSNGWAMSMQGLKRQRDKGVSAAELVVRPPDELLSENAERWQGRLEPLLLLLALLEPCAALSLSHLQTWWRHTHNEKVSAPTLRRTLRPVEEMLQPLGGGDAEVRLVHTAFAAFVRDQFFSRADLVAGFDALCAWLATDLPDSADLLAAPIIHWSTRLRVPSTQSDGLTKLFIALYDEPAESSRLDLFRRSRSRIANEAPATWLDGVRQAANADVLSAMRALGLRLLDGDGIAQDTDEGERWLRKAADAGYCPAIVSLGARLRLGDVIPMDINGGNSLLFKGAERGDADAMLYLGVQLVQGDGLSQDVNQGLSWLRKAANSSHPYAMFALGFELLSGRHIHQDTAEAASWLRRAAEANVPFAMILYASCLIDGLGCEREPSDGLNWLRKAANSTQTHPLLPPELATFTLASALLHIQVEEENSAEGIQLLRKAAEAGNTFAMAELGSRILDGRNTPLEPEDGLAWLRKAAEAGNNLAMTDIGGRFLDGRGVPQNHSEGVAWLHRAVEPTEDPFYTTFQSDATRELAQRLMAGRGVQHNRSEGIAWLRESAERGNVSAMMDLAIHLLEGDANPSDTDEGTHWLCEAASKGNALAMGNLGIRLIDGRGLPQDTDEGVRWLRKAAVKGYASAAAGELYERLLFKDAAEIFAAHLDSPDCANSLLYMLRRGEVPSDHPANAHTVASLLQGPLERMPDLARVNLALCDALGFQRPVDWRTAAIGVLGITDATSALTWWGETASKGDPEGDLVLAWLNLLHDVQDPELRTAGERLERARSGGIDVPFDHFDTLSKLRISES